ncbi:DUF533 domain-containing protein [Paracoccus sulfuroxidans]|uniref:Uncharacterized membrane protein YebE (DUF533 family) n=1 Tax=Paracoccus sulfuroxidans TaxID=384678 RepID=A0A562NRJ0_9RHOB|nr:DUF533 domain-containing protein [Paracoccus sulfuroxidans]TWI34316.1 uncharacterized membrane protein YebE (DUF533 family) [Paracoccus sulfuroxidans]
MSLMKSLARVAAGVMLAKGIGTYMKNRQQGGTSSKGQGGILGDLLQNNTSSQGGRQAGSGGLGDVLGQVLGGRSAGAGSGARYGGPNSRGAQGGLGGILDDLTSSRVPQSGQRSGGALGGILGGAAAGGLGGILGDLLGGGSQAQAQTRPGTSSGGGLAQRDSQPSNDASFGELFNDSVTTGKEPEVAPTPEQNALAGLFLKAMIQAAKSDGTIDEAEKARLMEAFGDIDEEDRAFIREQMAAPVDAKALAAETPKEAGPQLYLMSLMAIDFDNEREAQYLHTLAEALGLDRDTVNQIHAKVGVQNLYA